MRAMRLNVLAFLVLLLGLAAAQIPQAAAHAQELGSVVVTNAAQTALQPATSCHASQATAEHHPAEQDGDASHQGCCCAVSCGASALAVDAPAVARKVGNSRNALAPKTTMRGLGIAPPHGPPRSDS